MNAITPIVDKLAEEIGSNPRIALYVICVLALALIVAIIA